MVLSILIADVDTAIMPYGDPHRGSLAASASLGISKCNPPSDQDHKPLDQFYTVIIYYYETVVLPVPMFRNGLQ